MEINIDDRRLEIERLRLFTDHISSELNNVLEFLGWDIDSFKKEETVYVKCPLEKSHKVTRNNLEAHVEKCSWRQSGYLEDDIPLSEGSSGPSSILIDKHLQQEIIDKAKQYNVTFRSKNTHDVPRTANRSTADFTQDERLAIYNYAVSHTQRVPEIPEFGLPVACDAVAKPEKSILELTAEERDARRRRQKYKGVHTNKKNYTEVIREIIRTQMDDIRESKNIRDSKEQRLLDDGVSSRSSSKVSSRGGSRKCSVERVVRNHTNERERNERDRDRDVKEPSLKRQVESSNVKDDVKIKDKQEMQRFTEKSRRIEYKRDKTATTTIKKNENDHEHEHTPTKVHNRRYTSRSPSNSKYLDRRRRERVYDDRHAYHTIDKDRDGIYKSVKGAYNNRHRYVDVNDRVRRRFAIYRSKTATYPRRGVFNRTKYFTQNRYERSDRSRVKDYDKKERDYTGKKSNDKNDRRDGELTKELFPRAERYNSDEISSISSLDSVDEVRYIETTRDKKLPSKVFVSTHKVDLNVVNISSSEEEMDAADGRKRKRATSTDQSVENAFNDAVDKEKSRNNNDLHERRFRPARTKEIIDIDLISNEITSKIRGLDDKHVGAKIDACKNHIEINSDVSFECNHNNKRTKLTNHTIEGAENGDDQLENVKTYKTKCVNNLDDVEINGFETREMDTTEKSNDVKSWNGGGIDVTNDTCT